MARKGGRRHLKRLAAPKFWPIPRKEFKWAVKPSPGPHPADNCLPLLVIIRDILGLAETAREARMILGQRKILVDGRVRTDYKYPVGLMDVVAIPELKKAYRCVPKLGGGLTLLEIPEEEACFKLCRIEDKTTVNGGHIQLNLHDGRNVLVRIQDPLNPVEDVYKTGDVLKLSLIHI